MICMISMMLLMLPGGIRIICIIYLLQHMFTAYDLSCTDTAQPLTPEGEELDDVDDVDDLQHIFIAVSVSVSVDHDLLNMWTITVGGSSINPRW